MKLKILILILSLVCFSVAIGSQQQPMLTGTVTDSLTGEPLPGVHVLIEGTSTGTSTDLNGKYALPKPEKNAVIAFSFVGYVTEQMSFTGQTEINLKLSPSVKALDDVVVIGYGTIKKSDLTGSVASVASGDIEKTKPANIELGLEGRVPGLIVTANSGAPGSEAIIRVRGIGTVNNNNPIYVVDGMLVDNSDPNNPAGNISFLNPADISSIEVLKDASAQAIYGSRGANGVILITTRKGTEGMPMVTFSSSIGFDNVTKMPKVLNATGCKDYILTSNYNGYIRMHPDSTNVNPATINQTTKQVVEGYNKGINTNWLDEVTRKNVLNQNYDLMINGGSKYSHYLASAGYNYTDGLIKKYNYKRFAFRLNTDFKFGKNVTIGENLGITSAVRKNTDYAGPFQGAMWAYPMDPVLKPTASVDPADPDYIYSKYAAGIGGDNPALGTELQFWKSVRLTLVGNMFAEVAILKDLKFRSSWGFNLAYQDISDFSPRYFLSENNQNGLSTVSSTNNRTNGWVWENTVSYSKTLTNHSITALVGYTSEYTKASYQSESKQGTPNNTSELQTFDAATSQPLVSGGYTVNTMISYLGRINYSFRDKYLLTASVRRDGSSKFGPGNHWGTFPSFSLGWRINNEEILKNLFTGFISNLKLRAGWGQIGNLSLPVNYAYVSQVSSAPSPSWASNLGTVDNRYIFNGIVSNGYSLSTIGTPSLTWETSEQTNIGLEIGILKNALSFTADYYVKNTNKMLLQVPPTMYAGYPSSGAPYTNIGSVQNKGIEIIINWQKKTGDFSYGLSVNGSMFKNNVISLGRDSLPIISPPSRTQVGSSIGRFYGYLTDGIFQTEKEVQDYKGTKGTLLQPDAHAGDIRFKNLNNDEVIDVHDETWIGSPLPTLTYGFNINLEYKAFDLTAFFQGSYGNKIFKIGIYRQLMFEGTGNMLEYIYESAWKGEGTSNTDPLLTTVNNNDNFRLSDYFIEDGSYMRLKNLQFGYNLPKSFCNKVKITKGRIWVGETNLITLTKYRGIDPEVDSYASAINAGYDWNNLFPQVREMLVGVTISF
jgi:TonB-dependent starch-binding outer membrane protein SusC